MRRSSRKLAHADQESAPRKRQPTHEPPSATRADPRTAAIPEASGSRAGLGGLQAWPNAAGSSMAMRQAAFSQLAGVLGNHTMSALVNRRTPDRSALQRRETPDTAPADVNVDFPACVAILKDLTAAQIIIIRKDYKAREGRPLDEDLFGGGESGFPTNLKVDQILQLGALLGGTKATQAASDEEKRVAAANDAAAQAAELHSLLHGKLDKGDRDQVMATLRRGPIANVTVIAAYQRLYGVALGGDIARLGPVEMVRATLLLAGNVGGADVYKVNTLKSRITEIDAEIPLVDQKKH